jgi:hypothetical protein
MGKEIRLSSTTLQPPWLGVIRLAWILLTGTAFVLTALGLSQSWIKPLPVCTTPEAVCAPWVVSQEDIQVAAAAGINPQWILATYYFGSIFPKIIFGLVGLLIFWRRSQDWVALLLALMLTLFSLEGVINLGALTPLADWLYALATIIFGLLLFIFPTGRFEPGWIVWPGTALTLLATVGVFSPKLGIVQTEAVYAILILGSFTLWFILTAYSVTYRYKHVSTVSERQQTKWVLAGILSTFIMIVPFVIISLFYPPSQPSLPRLAIIFLFHYPIYFISYLFLPGGIAFAILRYRLWDIDVIVRRTMVYSALTFSLALIYFGGVTLIQLLFSTLSGYISTGQAQSPAAVVFSTLLTAAMFAPLRRRMQAFVDRRFYRRKYDAGQALNSFIAIAREEVSLEQISAGLLEVVDETVQPELVSLWFKPPVGRNR